MSNAMRFGKRTLAGVAAGALALGALSIAGATSASAKPNVKPKVGTVAATASAVRPTGTGASTLSIPPAKLAWAQSSGVNVGPTNAYVDLITAPTGAATMTVWKADGTQDDTVTLNQNADVISGTYLVGDDTGINFNVDTAGLYSGIIANGVDTATFSFTTAGTPVSMTLTPTSQTVLVGATAKVTVALKDAAGATTQPQTVDSVTMATTGDDTISFTTALGNRNGKLQYGTFDDTIRTQTAGSSTITATPLGTLPATGVMAATATLTKSGTVASIPIADMYVTKPINAIDTSPSSAFPQSAQVPENTTNVEVLVDDTPVNPAGTQLRFKAVLTAGGTLNGAAATNAAPQYLDVTTDALKQATLKLTLGGAATLNNSVLQLTQVNVANSNVGSVALNITWKTPAVQSTDIIPTPRGNIVAKVGASTNVAVLVDDSFGTVQSGWTVRAYRGTVSGANLLSTGTTNAAGIAAVTVAPLATTLAGASETYVFTAQAPVNGTEVQNAAALNLIVTYTASGNITSLSVSNSAAGNGAGPCTNLTCVLTAYPSVRVPATGVISGTPSTEAYAVATATRAGTASNMATFTPDATPNNAIVVTVPDGVKVSTTNPATTTTAWDGGAQTATVADNTPVYVWATKAGTHDIVFTSGGLTVTTKLNVYTIADYAYNIEVTPATQKLSKGAFGTAAVTVTDAFGNKVPGNNVVGPTATNVVTGATSGETFLLGGFTNTSNLTVGATGTGTFTLIAGQVAGVGTLTVTPTLGDSAPAWVTGYVKPTGFPTPKTSAVVSVEVTSAASDKTITITDSGRTTVSGMPGVYANGSTTGFAAGDTLKVYVKFPGQTSYTEGSAKPPIAADGTFEWSRKTGKKTYLYFTNDDGKVKSNSVIIQAN